MVERAPRDKLTGYDRVSQAAIPSAPTGPHPRQRTDRGASSEQQPAPADSRSRWTGHLVSWIDGVEVKDSLAEGVSTHYRTAGNFRVSLTTHGWCESKAMVTQRAVSCPRTDQRSLDRYRSFQFPKPSNTKTRDAVPHIVTQSRILPPSFEGLSIEHNTN